MKHLLFLIFVLAACSCFAQSNIHFDEMSLQQALGKSRIESKPVFFMGYASWCEHCKNMKEHVFTDDSVADFYNSTFICIMMDMEKGDGISLAKKFTVTSYPAFIFLDSTGKTIYQVVGELNKTEFIREGKYAVTPVKQLPYLRQQFELNPSDTDKCLQYLFALNHARLPTMKVADTYFISQNNHPPFTLMNWRILNAGVSDVTTPEFRYIIDHRKEFSAVMNAAKVDRKIFRTAAYNLQPLANSNDTTSYFVKRNLVAGLDIKSLDSLIFNLDLMIFENNNRWEAYQSTALKNVHQFDWDDYATLRHIADIFLKHVTDKAALQQAVDWAEHSTELKEEYGNTLLYAKLLEKSGDTIAASEAAKHAKELATHTNENTLEADQLLQRLEK